MNIVGPARSLNGLKRACERGGGSEQQPSLQPGGQPSLLPGGTCGPLGINPLQVLNELALVAAVRDEEGGATRVKFPDLDIEGLGIDDHSNADIRDPAGNIVSPAADRLDALRVIQALGEVGADFDFLTD